MVGSCTHVAATAPQEGEPFADLEELLPVAPETEVEIVIACPMCGGKDPVVQMVEDAEVATCGDCGCDFCPDSVSESLSKRLIRTMRSLRQARFEALNFVDTKSLRRQPTHGHEFLSCH